MNNEPIEFLVLSPSEDGEGVFHVTPHTRCSLEKFLEEATREGYGFHHSLPTRGDKRWQDQWHLRDGARGRVHTYAIIRFSVVTPKPVKVVEKFEITE